MGCHLVGGGHKHLSRELCAPGLRVSGQWSLRLWSMAATRTVGEGQGTLAWCLSSPAQGCPSLSSAREQQGGSSLARANEEGVSLVSEQTILYHPIPHSLFAS